MKAVIMAGGQGKRIRPLSHVIPKPLLPIGRKPILQILIEQLREAGVTEIIISTGYKDYLIKNFFQDGNHFGVKINYTYEKESLGTAGPLALVAGKMEHPFFVVNGDILTKLNFQDLYRHHLAKQCEMTIGVSTYSVELPYGIINVDNGRVAQVMEKPSFDYTVIAGIYVMNPSVLDYLTPDQPYDLPQLINCLLDDRRPVSYYQIKEPWHDIGRLEDLEMLNGQWS